MAGEFENDDLGNDPSLNATDQALVNDSGDGDASAGKHLLLMVPDFTNTEEALPGTELAAQAPMNSYLRLGMADSRAGDPTQIALGEDLATYVWGFTDDYRERGDDTNQPANSPQVAPDPAGSMDNGSSLPYAPPTTTSTADDFPKAESLQLHMKGGWRDHSDGNRITTTRGDKIEIIRGNYKLLVLGRNDDVGNATGVEMSGGLIDSDSSDLSRPTKAERDALALSAGLDVTWKWVQDSDTNWRWHVTTLNGNTGAGAQSSGSVGYEGTPVASTSTAPTMTTTTWAYDIASTTNAHSVSTTTTTDQNNDTTTTSNNASVTNKVFAPSGTIHNHSSAQDIVNENFATVNIFNETAAPLQESLQQVGLNTVFNLLGGQVQVDAALVGMAYGQFCGLGIVTEQAAIGAIISAQQSLSVLSSVIAASTVNNVTAPIQANCFTGTVADIHMPIHIDNHAGVHIDNHAGAHVDVHMGLHYQTADEHTGTITMGDVQTWLGPKAHMFVATNVNLTASTQYSLAGMTVTM